MSTYDIVSAHVLYTSINLFAYQIVLVIAVPAIGARQLARMLYFRPSKATVRVRPRIPAFAVEY